ncbi:MAG TPA: hypothetical protein VLS90_14505 [Thermodesulfobacteriota bacterium]|nr:hypothetical protein [Thermodesulfobacteriota bacterium]
MKRLLTIAFLFFIGGLALFAPPQKVQAAEVLLLHTNNVTGHLFPCPT